MLLIFHISVALTSLIVTALSLVLPSRRKLTAAYLFFGLTITSGTYLVVSTSAALVPSCLTGLIYSAVALSGITSSRRKLSHSYQIEE